MYLFNLSSSTFLLATEIPTTATNINVKMTILCIDTHLVSDPNYNPDDKTAKFYVAFDKVHVECRVHLEEVFLYLYNNKIVEGVQIVLYGNFLTVNGQQDGHNYIRVNSVHLRSVPSNKKRRMEDTTASAGIAYQDDRSVASSSSNLSNTRPASYMSIVSFAPPAPSPIRKHAAIGPYYEYQGNFNDYYFMMLGKAAFLLTQFQHLSLRPNHEALKPIIDKYMPKFTLLDKFLSQIHSTFIIIVEQGMDGLKVWNFVSTATKFVELLIYIKKGHPYDIFISQTFIDTKTPLPSLIYDYYINYIE
jgi:hypothetical protein